MQQKLTASQEILIAANKIDREGKTEFSEWDLTVAVWQSNMNKFGCRGYESSYPDHKRVMMEIMGQTKKDNPIRKGWIKKTRPNFYKITSLGRAEAERIEGLGEKFQPEASVHNIHDSLEPYLIHKSFRDYLRDNDQPQTWLAASSFLGITRRGKVHLEDRFRFIENAITIAKQWFDRSSEPVMRRGVTGGGIAITVADVQTLDAFLQTLKERFKVQIEAISRNGA